jgi:hypothetical protein
MGEDEEGRIEREGGRVKENKYDIQWSGNGE